MRIFTVLISLFSVIATALPLIQTSHWWIRIFDYPRLQVAVLCLIAVSLNIFCFRFKNKISNMLIVMVVLAFTYQFILIIRYTPLYPIQAEAVSRAQRSHPFSIMQSNIKMDNRQVEEFIDLVREQAPDIVVINEPDQWWEEKLTVLDSLFPYHVKKPLDNTYGMILYSRLPLKQAEVHFLVKEDIPSIFARVALPEGEFDLYCLHPQPPKPGSPTYERDTEILLVGETVKEAKRPAVVVGDLNDVAWSYTSELFQRISGLLDPREGRGFYNTYNVFVPLFRYPLDHFFYSDHFGLARLQKLASIGSDHFPMLIELHLNPQHDYAKRTPKADREDQQEVEDRIEKGR